MGHFASGLLRLFHSLGAGGSKMELKQRRRRQTWTSAKQYILVNSTMALHVRYTAWYISLAPFRLGGHRARALKWTLFRHASALN